MAVAKSVYVTNVIFLEQFQSLDVRMMKMRIRTLFFALSVALQFVSMSSFGLMEEKAMSWEPFNYSDFECGLFWLLAESPDCDVDTDDYGRTVGTYTGEVSRSVVLARVEEDHDGLPYFDAVDSANFGRLADDDVVTHFANVVAPAIPAN